jgi:putative sugar O-methyltransferase
LDRTSGEVLADQVLQRGEVSNLNYHELLAQRLAELESAPDLYRPTQFWGHGVRRLLSDIDKFGFESFKAWPEASYWFYPKFAYGRRARMAETWLARVAPEREQKLFRKLPEKATGRLGGIRDFDVLRTVWNQDVWPTDFNISEQQCGQPKYLPSFSGAGGPRMNKALMNYLLCLAALSQHTDRPLKHFLELGGGFGALGEAAFALDQDASYYNYDLPPLSVVAEYYLDTAFSHRKHQVRSTWELPDHQEQADVFFNTYSFQEMEPHVVDNYVNVISGIRPEFIVSMNSTNGKRRAKSEKHVGVVNPVSSASIEARFADHGYKICAAYKDPIQRGAGTLLIMRRS